MVCKIIRQTLRPSGADDLRGFYSVHRASPHLSRNGLCACSIRHTPPPARLKSQDCLLHRSGISHASHLRQRLLHLK